MASTGDSLDIVAQVLQNLRRIMRSVDLHSQQLRRSIGLTGPQLLVLTEIQREPGLSSGELARRVSLSHPTVTSILDRLEARGLVTRTRTAQDRRRVELRLTEEAERRVEHSPTALQEAFVQNFARLEDWEKSQILASLQRLTKLMYATEIPAEAMLSSVPIEQEVHGGEPVQEDEGKI